MQSQSREADIASILDDLRRIVRELREASRSAERTLGVTAAQLFVLKMLAEAPTLSLSGLARRTSTHQSTVSVVVKRLVSARLVTRVTSATDARRVELAVTARGRALLKKAPLAAQERLIESIEQLPNTQRKALANGLRQVVTGMLLDQERPVMFFEEEEPQRERKTNSRASS